jgi:hypothetical protein
MIRFRDARVSRNVNGYLVRSGNCIGSGFSNDFRKSHQSVSPDGGDRAKRPLNVVQHPLPE